MSLLILESLGSTELLFILVMALVFFGPRKLPQISRSLGKNLADFRRASEDFKTTWHREVNLEEFNILGSDDDGARRPEAPKLPDDPMFHQPSATPTNEAVTPERSIARQPADQAADQVAAQTDYSSHDPDGRSVIEPDIPSRKRDWL